jgi:hypothetical protein
MTTPNITSPNVRILVPEVSLPADAPKSQTPLAEAALAELLQGGRLGIRDMYKPVDGEEPGWPYLDVLRAGLAAIDADHADAEKAAKAEAAGAFTEAGKREKAQRETPWWDRTPVTPDPATHPYAGVAERVASALAAAPVAEPVPEPAAGGPVDVMETWIPPQYAQDAAEKTYGPAPAAGEAERDPAEDAPAGRAVADDEPAPATDATAVLVDMAQKQEAAKEPDATQVIAVTGAPTQAVPAVKEEGEPDE